jgi:hypothetical protein
MKNFIINPAAKNIELRVRIAIDELQTLGWDFDTYHKNTADAMSISIEAAEQQNLQNYIAEISLKGKSGSVKTDYTWYSLSRNENTEYKATGDDLQTIQDIIGLLNNGELNINDNWDYTTNESGEYVPTFIGN